MGQHSFIPLVTFRGWNIEDKEWVYGFMFNDMILTGKIVGSQYNQFEHRTNYTPEQIKIDKDSLGIYTGKDDKNGTPIFCGVAGAKYGSDIVEFNHYDDITDNEVDYDVLNMQFIIEASGDFSSEEMTIIGNQYEQHLATLSDQPPK